MPLRDDALPRIDIHPEGPYARLVIRPPLRPVPGSADAIVLAPTGMLYAGADGLALREAPRGAGARLQRLIRPNPLNPVTVGSTLLKAALGSLRSGASWPEVLDTWPDTPWLGLDEQRVLLVAPRGPSNPALFELLARGLVRVGSAVDVLTPTPHRRAWSPVAAAGFGVIHDLESPQGALSAYRKRTRALGFHGAWVSLDGAVEGVGDGWQGRHTTCPPLFEGESWERRVRLQDGGWDPNRPEVNVRFFPGHTSTIVPIVRRA